MIGCLRFLRFSFTHRTQRKRLRLDGNRALRFKDKDKDLWSENKDKDKDLRSEDKEKDL